MDKNGADDSRKSAWRGEAGLGSGFTGGDHLAYNTLIPLLILGGVFGVGKALFFRPLWMLGWLTPVAVFALGAFLLRKRSRPLYLFCVLLASLAGLCAIMASCAPEPKV